MFNRLTIAGFLVLCIQAHALVAELPLSAFDQANKLYELGKYGEAAHAYEQMLHAGKEAPAIHFNLGNALLKSGQLGRAIGQYRLAEWLAPRDPDIRANLQYARNSANAGVRHPLPPWLEWNARLTINEWTLFWTAALWLWFGLLAAGQLGLALKQALRGYTATVGVAVLLLGACLGLAVYQRYGLKPAVVVAREVVLRYGPLEESQSFFTLRDGAEVDVLAEKDQWLQVMDAARRIGWLRRDQVLVLAPRREFPGTKGGRNQRLVL
jgi:tetratricopeptide (TPR) repeat protein